MFTKAEYNELQNTLLELRNAYVKGNPKVSDYEYDQMMQTMKSIEKEHPEWVTETSVTQTVGDELRENGVQVKHNTPMLSIEDVFTKEDVTAFVEKVKNIYPDATFSVERKIDGLSITLRYDEGKLILAETRGDGYTGEDVTVNANVIPNIPKTIPEKRHIEIRGEVYMNYSDFDNTNKKQEMLGKKIFANPRNCAAGTLRVLDSKVTKERGLSFFAFNIQNGPDEYMQNHCDSLDTLKTWGIPVVFHEKCTTDEEILKVIDSIGTSRGDLDYDIDGAVVKVNEIRYREDFPSSSKYSAGHIAYKYPPEEKETILRDIEISVGMTGKLTPTAIFDPIRLCGTTVSRATLHNQDFITENHIGIGDTIIVYKSGEIIPKVKGTVPEKRPNGVQDYQIPNTCPVCGSLCTREQGEADIKCRNISCPAQLKRKIYNFAERENMDIRGLGTEAVHALTELGLIRDFSDIYTLHTKRKELIDKKVVGKEKATDNLLKAIDASKTKEAWRLLGSLGIDNVGVSLAKPILQKFGSIHEVMNASKEELMEINGVGEVLADNIIQFFSNETNKSVIQKLEEYGVNMEDEKEEKGSLLEGMTFVVTGDVNIFKNRNAVKEYIESQGGKMSGSVSKKTTALINNDNTSNSSKNKKAKELGIPIITEDEFVKKYTTV